MSRTSITRIANTFTTGTRTMVLRMGQATKRHRRKVIYTGLAVLASIGMKFGYDHYREHQRIHSQVNPAESCYLYHPETILSDIEFEDRRITRNSPFEMDDIKNIFASIDYRFTSGLRKVVLTGKNFNGEGELVTGRYEVDTQTIYLYESRIGASYLALESTCRHEVGHHVQQKLIDLGSEIPLWEGADGEFFAQSFALVSLSYHPKATWKMVNSYQFNNHPTSEQLDSMRKHLFCSGPDFNGNNAYALSVKAKTFLDFGYFDEFLAVFEQLQQMPFNPMAPIDIRNYWALRQGNLEYLHPFSLYYDLLKAKNNQKRPYLTELNLPEENLRRASRILREVHNLGEDAYKLDRYVLGIGVQL